MPLNSPSIRYFKMRISKSPEELEAMTQAHNYIFSKYPNARKVRNYYEAKEYVHEFIDADPTEQFLLAKLTLSYCYNISYRKQLLNSLIEQAQAYIIQLESVEMGDTLQRMSF